MTRHAHYTTMKTSQLQIMIDKLNNNKRNALMMWEYIQNDTLIGYNAIKYCVFV